ncbi:MAG TPA: hypothetical protein PLM79_03855 [Syntrophobacteraceae bacterium]|nr:hypothetical protein [Syntrophobacteraceae bacterium]
MKILETQRNESMEKTREASRPSRPGPSGAFQELLNTEVGDGPRTTDPSPPGVSLTGLDSLNAMSLLTPISGTCPKDPAEIALSVGRNLDRLARELEGPGSSEPKRTEALIESLRSEAERLREETRSLPEDHPLRKISDELSVTAYVESIKWNRGDYL